MLLVIKILGLFVMQKSWLTQDEDLPQLFSVLFEYKGIENIFKLVVHQFCYQVYSLSLTSLKIVISRVFLQELNFTYEHVSYIEVVPILISYFCNLFLRLLNLWQWLQPLKYVLKKNNCKTSLIAKCMIDFVNVPRIPIKYIYSIFIECKIKYLCLSGVYDSIQFLYVLTYLFLLDLSNSEKRYITCPKYNSIFIKFSLHF